MKFLKPIPDLGPCEGRWVTAFGSHRVCPYRACETFESPCGHVHKLCATCVYALERGMGTWDEMDDFLHFGGAKAWATTSEAEIFLGTRVTGGSTDGHNARRWAARRHTSRVPLHVVFAGAAALAALIIVGLPSLVVTGATALGTAAVLYSVAMRYAGGP